ncbi:ice-binding family protein [Cellulomonas hominis]|uniref:ice-binding family protein n=1 Tax=Cellulomonas hominis TaxID=156981 RepID=UPI001BCD654A|nr:ice-binding family protein [Cellulomonas hominis]
MAAPAGAASYEDAVGLGTAGAYSVLAGSTVTNTGPSVLSGELGVSPGNAITGFPPGTAGGAIHAGDAAAASAQSSLTTAYLDAEGRAPTGTSLGSAVAGGTYLAGVYNATSSLGVSGAVTLDGEGDPNAVFVFQVGASMTTASSTSIVLTGNAQACNVFWQVGASATLGSSTAFAGTVMALTSITLDTGTTVAGRVLARNGAVTLDDNVFTDPSCVSTPTTTTVTASPATAGGSTTVTATVSAVGAATPTGTVTFTADGVAVGTATIGPDGVATLSLPVGTATDVTLVADYSGFGSYAPSSSAPTVLVVTPAAAPAVPVAAPVPAAATADDAAAPGTALAESGPAQTWALVGAAAVLVLGGLCLTRAAASRRPVAATHR